MGKALRLPKGSPGWPTFVVVRLERPLTVLDDAERPVVLSEGGGYLCVTTRYYQRTWFLPRKIRRHVPVNVDRQLWVPGSMRRHEARVRGHRA